MKRTFKSKATFNFKSKATLNFKRKATLNWGNMHTLRQKKHVVDLQMHFSGLCPYIPVQLQCNRRNHRLCINTEVLEMTY